MPYFDFFLNNICKNIVELFMILVARVLVLIAAVVGLTKAIAGEISYTVEDKGLVTQNTKLTQAIIGHKSFVVYKSLGCRLIGEAIDLSYTNRVFLFTTKDACGWGSALGPIWIVLAKKNSDGKVVLDAGGYSVVGKSNYSHGMRDLEIRSGTAGFVEVKRYSFDGMRYKVVGS